MSSAPPWRLKATSLEAPATPAAQPTPPRHRQRWQRHRRRPPSRGGRRRRVVCSLPRVPEGRGRTCSAALARGGRRSPGTAAPYMKRTGLVEKLWSTSPPPTQKTVSWGSEHVHLFIPPPATAPCWHAFGGGRVLAAGAPRVPPAAHPSSPPPPGQHARVIGRVSVIPPNAAPSSMRLQECTDLRRLSVHQLQLQRTAKTPLTGSPRHPCVTPRSHGPLLPRRHREPQRPPTASCAMHCTPLVQDLQRHTHTAPAPPRPLVRNARAAPTRELTPKLRTGRFSRRGDSGVGSKGHRCKAG